MFILHLNYTTNLCGAMDEIKVLSDEHWKKATYVHLQPEHTHVINLQQPEEEIIASMAQPVRNCYRNYHKKGITVHRSQSPDEIKVIF